MPKSLQVAKTFRSQKIKSIELAKIDREKGVISDVVLSSVGEAKGHGVHLEQSFIDDLVSYAVANYSEVGLSARFGHPDACSPAMGTQLGKFKNFRVDGDKAIADLHVLSAAKISPTHGNMFDWVFQMAEERPSELMNSIVFNQKGLYQYNEKGEKVNLEFDEKKGYQIQFDDKKVFVELDKLLKSDLVEDGAATDNLFANKINSHLYVAQVGLFFEQHPHLKTWALSNQDKVKVFFEGMGFEFKQNSIISQLKKLVSGSDQTALSEELASLQLQSQQDAEKIELEAAKVTVLTGEKSEWTAKELAFKAEIQTLKSEIERLGKLVVGNDPTKFGKTPPKKEGVLKPWDRANFE